MEGTRDLRSSLPNRAAWRTSLLLFVGLWLAYSANRRWYWISDTESATLLPLAILRGDGPYLDRFERLLRDSSGRLPFHVARRRGHLVPLYPLGPALLALPFELPQVLALDRLRPGWEDGPQAKAWLWKMGKNSAAAIAALAAVALWHLLGKLGLGRAAVPTVLAAALGSNLWGTASQALWQHGPAALALTTALLLLADPAPSRRRFVLAGLATGALVACRAIDAIFAAAIGLWVVRHHPRRLGAFLPFPVAIGAALVGGNLHDFGTVAGGQAILESAHDVIHGTAGAWSGSPLEGAAGTLLSPSRGLFVYTPWVALAVLAAPAALGRIRRDSVVRWPLAALVPFLLLLSTYSVWWAGHCFGPRYWTDAVPLFAVLLGAALERARTRGPIVRAVFALAIAGSIAVQALGAFCYPSSWNDRPTDVDRDHARLWDWRDTELSRGWAECVVPRFVASGCRARYCVPQAPRGTQ